DDRDVRRQTQRIDFHRQAPLASVRRKRLEEFLHMIKLYNTPSRCPDEPVRMQEIREICSGSRSVAGANASAASVTEAFCALHRAAPTSGQHFWIGWACLNVFRSVTHKS